MFEYMAQSLGNRWRRIERLKNNQRINLPVLKAIAKTRVSSGLHNRRNRLSTDLSTEYGDKSGPDLAIANCVMPQSLHEIQSPQGPRQACQHTQGGTTEGYPVVLGVVA